MATRQHLATRPLLVILLMCCPAASGAEESSSLRMAVRLQEVAHQFRQRVQRYGVPASLSFARQALQ